MLNVDSWQNELLNPDRINQTGFWNLGSGRIFKKGQNEFWKLVHFPWLFKIIMRPGAMPLCICHTERCHHLLLLLLNKDTFLQHEKKAFAGGERKAYWAYWTLKANRDTLWWADSLRSRKSRRRFCFRLQKKKAAKPESLEQFFNLFAWGATGGMKRKILEVSSTLFRRRILNIRFLARTGALISPQVWHNDRKQFQKHAQSKEDRKDWVSECGMIFKHFSKQNETCWSAWFVLLQGQPAKTTWQRKYRFLYGRMSSVFLIFAVLPYHGQRSLKENIAEKTTSGVLLMNWIIIYLKGYVTL